MKPLYLVAMLAMYSSNSVADWTPVGSGNGIYVAFADKASIRRQGSMVTMHGLYDFRRQDFTPEGRGLHSTVVLREFDCAGRWEAVVAGGIDDAYLRVACATD